MDLRHSRKGHNANTPPSKQNTKNQETPSKPKKVQTTSTTHTNGGRVPTEVNVPHKDVSIQVDIQIPCKDFGMQFHTQVPTNDCGAQTDVQVPTKDFGTQMDTQVPNKDFSEQVNIKLPSQDFSCQAYMSTVKAYTNRTIQTHVTYMDRSDIATQTHTTSMILIDSAIQTEKQQEGHYINTQTEEPQQQRKDTTPIPQQQNATNTTQTDTNKNAQDKPNKTSEAIKNNNVKELHNLYWKARKYYEHVTHHKHFNELCIDNDVVPEGLTVLVPCVTIGADDDLKKEWDRILKHCALQLQHANTIHLQKLAYKIEEQLNSIEKHLDKQKNNKTEWTKVQNDITI